MGKKLEKDVSKLLDDISSTSHGTYGYHINIDNNFLKRAGLYFFSSVAGIATAAFISSKIVHHSEYLSLDHIKECLGF